MVRSGTRDAFPGSKGTRALSFLRRSLIHPSTSAAESVDPRPPSLPGPQESRRSAELQGGKGIPGPQERRVCRVGVGGVPSARKVDRGSNRWEESAGAAAAVGATFPPALPHIAPGRSEGVGEPPRCARRLGSRELEGVRGNAGRGGVGI